MEKHGTTLMDSPPRDAGSKEVQARPLDLLVTCDSVRRPIAGVGRVTLTLIQQLAALGQRITPLDLAPNGEAEECANPTRVIEPRLAWGRTALWHLELLRRLPPGEEDFLLDPTGYPDALGSHPNLVFWVHDLHMLERGFYRFGKRLWFKTLLRRGLDRARLVICVSELTRTRVLEKYAMPEEKVVVVPNALAPEMAADASPADPLAGESYYLAVGAIGGRKNTLRLLEAYAAACRNGLDAHLILAGSPGKGWRAVRDRLDRFDLRERVHLRQGVDDVALRGLYRGARGLLFPSLEEGFGLPILEAFAAGTPVLTSAVSAMPEVAGKAALLVDPLDTASIAGGLQLLEEDEDLRFDLAAKGRERLTLYTPERQARILLDHLHRIRDEK